MAAMIRTLLRMSLGAAALVTLLATGSAHAQSEPTPHRAPSPLFVPALVLIGAGGYLAYRRSRPTD